MSTSQSANSLESEGQNPAGDKQRPLLPAGLTALGVVFGDLGTSPLYTMQTITEATGGHLAPETAIGILSLLFWTLVLVVSIKYCLVVMRADNHGEGGILALMSLTGADDWKRGTYLVAGMGLLGAAFIYGDGVITPAISVLSALEGVNVATTALQHYVLPAGLAILLLLFAVQRFGTVRIGKAFGPVMLCWFVTIGVLGLLAVLRHPDVLVALNPVRGLSLLGRHPASALVILGGVFLCCTGAEALYADMGHVGRRPIRVAWWAIVLPALLLSYAGQTALLADKQPSGHNPFFLLAPAWALYPLVALATVATIIASQSIITGAFSMTQQAIQLGWLPRVRVVQTSSEEHGQVYVADVNWLMAAATIAIMLVFGSSAKLAGAYGMAVSTTMLLTTGLLFRVMRGVWHWPMAAIVPLIALFLTMDASFFVANLLKVSQGGYVPLALGAAIFTLMVTTRVGVDRVREQVETKQEPFETFRRRLQEENVPKTPGVGVFLTKPGHDVPSIIVEYVESFGAIKEEVVIVSVTTANVPRVAAGDRATCEALCEGFWRVDLRYGFMQAPDVPTSLCGLAPLTDKIGLDHATYFAARDFVVRDKERPRMARWSTQLFAYLFRNGARVPDLFNLPADRTIEIARQIAI